MTDKICKTCQGAGYIEIEKGKRADKYSDLPKHDGWKYKIKICPECKGCGFF